MIRLSSVSVRRVLDRIDLTVEAGEIVAILGPSGGGKSTLLRAILGLIPISHGSITIGTHANERTPPEERNLAMVFQDLALWPHLTADGTTEFIRRIRDY